MHCTARAKRHWKDSFAEKKQAYPIHAEMAWDHDDNTSARHILGSAFSPPSTYKRPKIRDGGQKKFEQDTKGKSKKKKKKRTYITRHDQRPMAPHHLTPRLRRRDLALVDRHQCHDQADPQPGNKPAHEEHGNVRRAGLDRAGDRADGGADLDRADPPRPVCQPVGEEGSDGAAAGEKAGRCAYDAAGLAAGV
jgi:hypothetical protein